MCEGGWEFLGSEALLSERPRGFLETALSVGEARQALEEGDTTLIRHIRGRGQSLMCLRHAGEGARMLIARRCIAARRCGVRRAWPGNLVSDPRLHFDLALDRPPQNRLPAIVARAWARTAQFAHLVSKFDEATDRLDEAIAFVKKGSGYFERAQAALSQAQFADRETLGGRSGAGGVGPNRLFSVVESETERLKAILQQIEDSKKQTDNIRKIFKRQRGAPRHDSVDYFVFRLAELFTITTGLTPVFGSTKKFSTSSFIRDAMTVCGGEESTVDHRLRDLEEQHGPWLAALAEMPVSVVMDVIPNSTLDDFELGLSLDIASYFGRSPD